MIVVSAADERFAPHVATLMHSVWRHNPHASFRLLDCGIEPGTLSTLRRWAERRGFIDVIKPDLARFDGLATTAHWSLAIYARLLIPELLQNLDRALYLDADTLVVDDLTQLWQTFMGDAAVAGVHDNGWRNERLFFPFNAHGYINSGVLLVNLAAWRGQGLAERVINFLHLYSPTFPDQTAINTVCRPMLVGDRWNVMVGDNERWRWDGFGIVHFTSFHKPWLYRDAPFARLYGYHRNHTPFPMVTPQARYRPTWRRAINLAIGRPKYWRALVRHRQMGAFTRAYFGEGDALTFLRDPGPYDPHPASDAGHQDGGSQQGAGDVTAQQGRAESVVVHESSLLPARTLAPPGPVGKS